MSRRDRTRDAIPHGFPRVSGDEPLAEAAGNLNAVFSPRERG